MTTWTKVEGEWAVRIEDSPYATGTGVGMPYTVTAKSGRKTRVILGAHVRTFRITGGRFVDVYLVDGAATDDARAKGYAGF